MCAAYVHLLCAILGALDLGFPTVVLFSLQGTGSCAFSKWEPDSTKKEMSLKNFVNTEIIKGKDKPLALLSVATLRCVQAGLIFAL